MAFSSIIGSLIRQSVSHNRAMNGPVPMSSMMNATRFMSSSKLFIGGLSWETDDQGLKEAFSDFGDVVEARIVTDRETGKSRGFGFVSYGDEESASSAISAMDGQDLNGRKIGVAYATERTSSGPGGGRGGGYRGGRENDY